MLGKVTDGSNSLGSITVEAYESSTGLWVNSVNTDDEGNYSLTLVAGDYKLRAFDRGKEFASEFFDNASTWNEAQIVTVINSNETTSINFSLSREAGFIEGNVKDDRNKPLKGIMIEVFDFDTDARFDSTTTDSAGRYKIAVSPGRYRVTAIPTDPRFSPVFFNNLIGNVTGWDAATPVSVSPSSMVQDVNFRLSTTAGIISGRVTDEDGNPLPEINVQVFDFDTNSWVNSDITARNGRFQITVPPGRYRIMAWPLDSASSLSSEFYDDARLWDLADLVTVEGGESVTLNDIKLSTGHSISGRVVTLSQEGKPVPQSRVVVDIYDFDTGSWINSTITDRDGRYIINGLQNKDYRVKAMPPAGSGLVGRFFDNVTSWDGAKRVSIASRDRDDIDLTLSMGGLITGKVIDEAGARPISGIEVDLYDLDTGVFLGHNITDGSGNYSIRVPSGTFLVRTTARGTCLVDEFFDNAINIDLAKPIVVADNTASNVDFQLTKGGKIIGAVKNRDKGGILGAEVNVFDFDTNFWINNDFTDSNGAFSINVLPGRYRLMLKAPLKSDFADVSLPGAVKVSSSEEEITVGVAPAKTGTDAKQTVKSTGAQTVLPFNTITKNFILASAIPVPTPISTLTPVPTVTPAPTITPVQPSMGCEGGGVPGKISVFPHSLIIRSGNKRRVRVQVLKENGIWCATDVAIDCLEGCDKIKPLKAVINTNSRGVAIVNIKAKRQETGLTILMFSAGDVKVRFPITIIR